MHPFTTLTATAAPLPLINIDTDMIIPKQFLKTIKRTGLGSALFHEMRVDINGTPIAGFILNRAPYDKAQILVAGANFGCGSSREHAPWALLDFGIRCVIAPSYADIFYNNCFKNGILPVILPQEQVDHLMRAAEEGRAITVDLPNQQVQAQGSGAFSFTVDAFRKHCLINGLDDIGLTLEKAAAIQTFEKAQQSHLPWLYKNQ